MMDWSPASVPICGYNGVASDTGQGFLLLLSDAGEGGADFAFLTRASHSWAAVKVGTCLTSQAWKEEKALLSAAQSMG